jgi:beta-aspartyl-peptidase (threonine type)
MKERSDGSAVVVVVGLIVILLLLVGGIAIFLLFSRTLTVKAEQARANESEARMKAERARENAALARAHRDATDLATDELSIRRSIDSVLRAQKAAWNRGDIDSFMEHYWKSDGLTFSSGGKTTRGWKETRDGYRERYPTREKMGRVSFDGLEIMPLGRSAALVLGQWDLTRESEPVGGNFSLVFRKIDGRWVIVHDHTSRLADPALP